MTGRHRRTAPNRSSLRTFAVALTVIVVLAGALVGYRQFTGGDGTAGCSDPARLAMAVAPEMAPAVRATVADWLRSRPTVGNRCIAVDVASVDSVDIAIAVAARANLALALAGVGTGSGQVRVPNLWIPDSSIWLQRLRATGPNLAPTSAPPVALSPVVVAMPEPVASQFGWPNAKVTWVGLFQKIKSGSGLRAGIVEPTRDAAGLSGLVSISIAANTVGGPNSAQDTATALKTLVRDRSAVRDDLFQRFPRSAEPAAVAGAIAAAPLSEQAVNAYNAKTPAVRLAPVYAEPAPQALDYPYTMLPGANADQTAIAGKLRTVLAGEQFRDRLAAVGLRAPDGSTGNGFPAGAPPVGGPGQGAAAADVAIVDRVLATWSAMSAPANTLAVIDISGSMLRAVPTAGGATRMQVLLEAAKRGLLLFDDSWSLGLWEFSTQLDGDKDYRELVPIGPLTAQRQQLGNALAAITPKSNGDTGLYDTIYAGYRTLQTGYVPGMVNSLIVMTDGENDDKFGGLSLDQLLAELGKIKDAKRPVRVLIITIGPEVAPGGLKPITDLTSGGVFAAPDPAKIGEIFLVAITTRAG